jgi:hypothetical protein
MLEKCGQIGSLLRGALLDAALYFHHRHIAKLSQTGRLFKLISFGRSSVLAGIVASVAHLAFVDILI